MLTDVRRTTSPMKTTYLLLLGAFAGVLFLAGCDGAEEDYTVAIDGLVYDETLGQPLEGIPVVMAAYPFGWFIEEDEAIAQAETDADGRYRLDVNPGRAGAEYRVQINAFPANPGRDTLILSRDTYTVWPGDRVSRTSNLYRFATLEVRAETDEPPSDDVNYYLTVVRRGSRNRPITNPGARANAYNRVKLVVDRGGVRTETADSVYCPLGAVTEYVFRY